MNNRFHSHLHLAASNPRYSAVEPNEPFPASDEYQSNTTAMMNEIDESELPESPSTPTPNPEISNADPNDGRIAIRVLALNGKVYNIRCDPTSDVAQVKAIVAEESGVRVGLQRLIYRGQVMEDDKAITDYKLEDRQTIHLFARQEPTDNETEDAPNQEETTSDNSTTDRRNVSNILDGHVVVLTDAISSAVSPVDGVPRFDPLAMDSPLGHCARRVKLWSTFFLIIYSMRAFVEFSEISGRHIDNEAHRHSEGGYYRYRIQYYKVSEADRTAQLLIHIFGVYVATLGFKASQDTVLRYAKKHCYGLVLLSIAAVFYDIYVAYRVAHSTTLPTRPTQPGVPTIDDAVTAKMLELGFSIFMWTLSINHALAHRLEILRYNEMIAASTVNPLAVNIPMPVSNSAADDNASSGEETSPNVENDSPAPQENNAAEQRSVHVV